MMRTPLLDTGPLVAFIDRRDRHNRWAMTEWADATPPLLTCEVVLAEACYLLRTLRGGLRAVFELLHRGVVTVPFRLSDETVPVARLLSRYASVPMSLADACLVRMSEQHAGCVLLTLDRDFRVYRRHGRQVIPTRMPPGV